MYIMQKYCNAQKFTQNYLYRILINNSEFENRS